jgi:hypothetical protein
MATVELNGNRIKDWPSFFACSAETFSRPELVGYSRAEDLGEWIEVLTGFHGAAAGADGDPGQNEELRIEVEDTERFGTLAPEVLARFVWAVGFANRHFRAMGQAPFITVQFR